jgi:transposase
MQELTTVGIGLAKSVFAMHAVTRDGRVVMRRMVSRGKLAELIAR